jgi:hypothetical protein
MPRRQDLSYWQTRVRRLADLEGDLHVSDAEIAQAISEVYGDLYHLVADGADAYFQTTYSIAADGSASYREPDDHMSTVVFELVETSGDRWPLRRLEAQERHLFNTAQTGDAEAYSLIDNALFLYPKPTSGTYELLYIPQPPDITSYSGTDLIDVVNIYGEQFLIHGAAAIVLSKSEADLRFHMARQARAEEKLKEWAAQRSFHDPHTQTIGDDVNGPRSSRFGPGGWPRTEVP